MLERIITLRSGRKLNIPQIDYNDDFRLFDSTPKNSIPILNLSNKGVPGTGHYSATNQTAFKARHPYINEAQSSIENKRKKDNNSRWGCSFFLLTILGLIAWYLYSGVDSTLGYVVSISGGVLMIFLAYKTVLKPTTKQEYLKVVKDIAPINIETEIQEHIQRLSQALQKETDALKKKILQNTLTAYKYYIHYHELLYAAETLNEEMRHKSTATNQSDLEDLIQRMTAMRKQIMSELMPTSTQLSTQERRDAYQNLVLSFNAVQNAEIKYKVVETGKKDSNGNDLVDRSKTNLYYGICNFLLSDYSIPTIEFDTNFICYFYPDFVLVRRDEMLFSCKSYKDFELSFRGIRFYETTKASIPSDAEIIDINTEHTIVRYGCLTHDNSRVHVSTYKALSEFHSAFQAYKEACQTAPKKAAATLTKTTEDAAKDTPPPFNITETYFNAIRLEVSSLQDLLTEMIANPNFVELLKQIYPNNDKITTDSLQKIIGTLTLFTSDFLYMLRGLHHDYRADSREAFPLILLLCNRNLNSIIYNDVNDLYHGQDIAQEFCKLVVQCKAKSTSNLFILDDMLAVAQLKDLQTRYLNLIYKIASLVAKADNVVTDAEQKYLATMVEWKEGSPSAQSNRTLPKINTLTIPDDSFIMGIDTSIWEKQDALSQLERLIGLQKVKDEVKGLYNLVAINKERERKGLRSLNTSYHCIFTGNPGTGKTTVARILANIFKELGVLKKGHLIETDRSGLVAEYVGQTATKTNEIVDSALDGVLFIDEAYALVQGGDNDYGKEAIATLLKRIEDDRDRLIVILAGYSNEMEEFLEINPGMKSRFNRFIDFPDYNAAELYQIFLKKAEDCDCHLTEKATIALKEGIEDAVAHKDKHFGNARFVRNCFEKAVYAQTNRLAKVSNLTENILSTIDVEDIQLAFGIDPNAKPEESKNALEQLRSMIGLAKVKEDIQNLYDIVRFNQLRKQQGFDPMRLSYHCVFTGNPGTGKTTVARIVADIYQELGILKKGHLVETDRSGLVAEYVGQTAIKTNKIIDSALDGVLFIDEAYTLAEGGNSDYGKEAIATLLKRMEDDRHRLVVILAGYTNEMSRFMEANSGLQSRFNRYIEFPDYTVEELCKIFLSICEKNKCILRENAKVVLQSYIAAAVAQKDEKFGNGRFVRNLYEQVFMMQAQRVSALPNPSQEDLLYIEEEDILKVLQKNKK